MGEIIEFPSRRAAIMAELNRTLRGAPAEKAERVRKIVAQKLDQWDGYAFRFELNLPSVTDAGEVQKIRDNFDKLMSHIQELSLENLELILKLELDGDD